MVRITEFESARVSPLTPEISASTSSAISALLTYITTAYIVCKVFFIFCPQNCKNGCFLQEFKKNEEILRISVFPG